MRQTINWINDPVHYCLEASPGLNVLKHSSLNYIHIYGYGIIIWSLRPGISVVRLNINPSTDQ